MPSMPRSLLLVAAALAGAAPAVGAAAPTRPNIVVIVADDLGWQDLHVTGHPWHVTPNLDRLAAQGTRFDHAYAAAPICTASRAALLTGRSPARLGIEFVIKSPEATHSTTHPLQPPSYPFNLPLSETTVAEVLGPAGYATGYFGKWHLAQHHGSYLRWSPTHGPLQQGYIEGTDDFGDHTYGDVTRSESERAPLPPGDYGRDPLTAHAVGFLRAHRDQPFYLHFSPYYVHDPFRTRASWLADDYAARLPAGTDRKRAVYAAMVELLDRQVGAVLAALDELDLTKNTLVVFTSDNGGHPVVSANGPLRGSKWNLYEAGLRVPWIIRWPGRVRAGATSGETFIGTDLLPTLCAAAGAPLPAGVALDGQDVLPLWLGQPSAAASARTLTWHFPYYHPEGAAFAKARPTIGVDDFAVSQTQPQSAIHVGDWKLIHFFADNRDELYRLPDDHSEQHNLAANEPTRTRELRAQLDATLLAAHARIPTPTAP